MKTQEHLSKFVGKSTGEIQPLEKKSKSIRATLVLDSEVLNSNFHLPPWFLKKLTVNNWIISFAILTFSLFLCVMTEIHSCSY